MDLGSTQTTPMSPIPRCFRELLTPPLPLHTHKHTHLDDVGDQVRQGFVHFDLLTVLFDFVFHGLEFMSDSQYLTLHDLGLRKMNVQP